MAEIRNELTNRAAHEGIVGWVLFFIFDGHIYTIFKIYTSIYIIYLLHIYS